MSALDPRREEILREVSSIFGIDHLSSLPIKRRASDALCHYSSAGLELLQSAFSARDHRAEAFADAVVIGVPEGYVRAIDAVEAARVIQRAPFLDSCMRDPVLGAALNGVRGEAPEVMAGIVAVGLVLRRLLDAGADQDSRFRPVLADYDSMSFRWRLASPELNAFILGRPEQAERIADIILARCTDDLEIICSVLDSKVPALAVGVL